MDKKAGCCEEYLLSLPLIFGYIFAIAILLFT